MPKQNKPALSPFSVLLDRHDKTETSSQPDVLPSSHSAVSSLPKSSDPAYQKFTVYVPRDLHRTAKAIASIQSRELSEIVAELLHQWIKSQKNTIAVNVEKY